MSNEFPKSIEQKSVYSEVDIEIREAEVSVQKVASEIVHVRAEIETTQQELGQLDEPEMIESQRAYTEQLHRHLEQCKVFLEKLEAMKGSFEDILLGLREVNEKTQTLLGKVSTNKPQ